MASEATTYHRGEMDIREQTATYEFVMSLTKWGSLAIAALLLFLVLWFCVDVGFFGSLFASGALAVIGAFLLRGRGEH